MTLPPIVMPDGYRFQLTNSDADDFVRGVMAIRITHPDAEHQVTWKLPERLLRRAEIWHPLIEEMTSEVNERREATVNPWTGQPL
jgi:hypothetical protein